MPRKYQAHKHIKLLPEDREQAKFFEYLGWLSNSEPIHRLPYAIPNARKCSWQTGYKFKITGVRSGIPDVHVPIANKDWISMYIEFKIKPNKLSDDQEWYMKELSKQGHHCIVAWSGDEAIEEYCKYLGIRPF